MTDITSYTKEGADAKFADKSVQTTVETGRLSSYSLAAEFGVFAIDTDGTYYITDYAGASGATIQFDTDSVPYFVSGA